MICILMFPKLKTRLGFFEKVYLSRKGQADAKKPSLQEAGSMNSYFVSSFVVSEIARFEALRNFIFNNYKIVLDCRNLDKMIVNCTIMKECTKKRCRNCISFFSETIIKINNIIDNTIASLSLIDAKKINKRNNLIIKICQTNSSKQDHIRIMLRTQLDTVVEELHKEKIEKNTLIVNLLNAKIRFINEIEAIIQSYFRYHVLRLNCYFESAGKKLPNPPVESLKICHSSFLDIYEAERKTATEKKNYHEKQVSFLYKKALASAIASVEIEMNGILIDTDEANVDYKKQWVTQAEWDAFINAIAIAQDAMSTVITEQQVTDEANALKTAVIIFNSVKKHGTYVDKEMLITIIAKAETSMNGILIDTDAANVDYKNQWVTQSELDALITAITLAENAIPSVTTDQQVTNSSNALKTSLAIFGSAKKQGTFVDKTALTAAIEIAEIEMNGILIDTDAANVDYKNQWVTQSELDALTVALTNAKDTMTTATSDQQITSTTDTLKLATETFEAAKKRGVFVDKTALIAAIEIAEIEMNGILIDTDEANVDYKNQWVTQTEWEALVTAITLAETAIPSVTTDQQMTNSSNALKTSLAIFGSAKKQGTFVDKTALTAAIEIAEIEMNGILIDTDAANVDYKNQWVTQSELDALTVALTNAKDTMTTATSDQQVTSTTDTLKLATETFEAAKKRGVFVDKTALIAAIEIAEIEMNGILIDTDEANVDYKNQWVTQTEWDALISSITNAKKAIPTISTDQQVTSVTNALIKTTSTFNSFKKRGTYVDKAAIVTALTNAEAAMSGVLIDTDGNNTASEKMWVTQEAFDVFLAAIEMAYNEMATATNDEQVTNASEILNGDREFFELSKKIGVISYNQIEGLSDDPSIELLRKVITDDAQEIE